MQESTNQSVKSPKASLPETAKDFNSTYTYTSAKIDLAYEFLDQCFAGQNEMGNVSMSAAAVNGLLCILGEAKDALEELSQTNEVVRQMNTQ
jgi:hypothetical protein